MPNQFSIQPADFSLGLNTALSGIVKGAEAKQERVRSDKDTAMMAEFAEQMETMTPVEVGQFVLKNPRIGKQIVGALDVSQQLTKEENLQQALSIATAYLTGEKTPDTTPTETPPVSAISQPGIGFDQDVIPGQQTPIQPPVDQPVMAAQAPVTSPELPGNPAQEEAVKVLTDRAELVMARGGDAKDSIESIRDTMTGGEQAFKGAMAVIAANDPQAFDRLMELQGGDEQELTSAQREFNSLTENLRPADVLLAKRISLGLDPRAVGSAVQTITEKGTAEEIADTEAVIAERKKFAEMTGSSRSKAIDKGFDRIQKLTKNISNIDGAISAVEGGANTGAITRRFPSLRQANVLLDQIQGKLALDVIGSVTFGALSQGELDLAKEIALPTGLEGKELINHLQKRKAAQTKLLSYFQEQIDFLDKGGSVAGFLRSKGRGASTVSQLPQGVTEEDITTTMQNNNMTREQVLARLAGQ